MNMHIKRVSKKVSEQTAVEIMVGKEKVSAMMNKLSGKLGIPGEIVFNLPLVTIVGRNEVSIENFKGIVEFGEERVRIRTASGELRLCGKGMVLRKATSESVVISGTIIAIEYMQ